MGMLSPIDLWKLDAAQAQRRRQKLEGVGGSKHGGRPRAADGSPACAHCGGPTTPRANGSPRMTCSPECEMARRRANKKKVIAK